MVTVEIEVIVAVTELIATVVIVKIEVTAEIEIIVVIVEEMLIQVTDRVINHFLHKIVLVFQNPLV